MKRILTFLLAAGCLNCFAQDLPARIDSLFVDYTQPGSPGLAALIVKDGKIIFEKGYGLANLEYNEPITPTSVFDIASVSKQFCGYAISTLIQQGKISPDDDIHKYLPDVPDFGKKITIRNLIHHTSGLRDWPEALHAAGWRWDESFSYDDIMRMVSKQHDLDFDPGSKYQYSNTGYNLLAAIVAKVTGKTFPDWEAEHVFKPLGMDHTQVLGDYSKVVPNLARSYYFSDGGYHNSTDQLTAFGSSSIFTTVEDLAKWVIFFEKGLDSKDPVIMRMTETDKLNDGNANNYAYGLAIGDDDGIKNINHTGGWASYATIISMYPDQHIGIILLGNKAGFDPSGSARSIAKMMIPVLNTPGAKREDLSKQPTVKVDTNLLKKYTGTFKLGPGWYVTFTLEGGKLMTQANGEDKFPTEMKSDTVMWVPAYNASVRFTDVKDQANAIWYKGNKAPRLIPVKPDVTTLGQYVGSYYSRELETTYKITLENGKLVAHHMRLGDFTLTPDMENPMTFESDNGTLVFYKNRDKIAGLKLSGARIRSIIFEKVSEP